MVLRFRSVDLLNPFIFPNSYPLCKLLLNKMSHSLFYTDHVVSGPWSVCLLNFSNFVLICFLNRLACVRHVVTQCFRDFRLSLTAHVAGICGTLEHIFVPAVSHVVFVSRRPLSFNVSHLCILVLSQICLKCIKRPFYT